MNPLVLKSLLKSLKDENPRVRAKTAETLGKIKDKSTVNELNALLEDKDAQVRESAEKALCNMGAIIKDNKVPEWKTYYPSLEQANKEQKEFYSKWLSEFKNGNYLDIEGNLSYIFVYLYSLLDHCSKSRDMDYTLNNFEKVSIGYGKYETIKSYLIIWKSQLYNSIGDHKKALEIEKEGNLPLVYALKYTKLIPKVENLIDGNDFVNFDRKYLSEFGYRNRKQIAKITDELLKSFEQEHGKHILRYFLENFNINNLTKDDFKRLKTFFDYEEDYLECKRIYETHERVKTPGFNQGANIRIANFGYFNGTLYSVDDSEEDYLSFNRDDDVIYIPYIVMEALSNEIRRILRESENKYRELKGLPKVGEGWVSETELYHLIKNSFPHENIIPHGKPSWLKPQHLDIYFTKKNIGIEYQGEQHQKPIDRFGGEEAFEYRQTLDERKKRLCEENDCNLIYVYPQYNFEDVKKEIGEILKRK